MAQAGVPWHRGARRGRPVRARRCQLILVALKVTKGALE